MVTKTSDLAAGSWERRPTDNWEREKDLALRNLQASTGKSKAK